MRSSASNCARQVLHEPLQKLTTTTCPRNSEMRTFSPDRPRATRSGAGRPSSSCFSAAAAEAAPRTRITTSTAASALAAKCACITALDRTNKRAYTIDSTRADTGQAKPEIDATRRARPSHSRLNNVNETAPGLRRKSSIVFEPVRSAFSATQKRREASATLSHVADDSRGLRPPVTPLPAGKERAATVKPVASRDAASADWPDGRFRRGW